MVWTFLFATWCLRSFDLYVPWLNVVGPPFDCLVLLWLFHFNVWQFMRTSHTCYWHEHFTAYLCLNYVIFVPNRKIEYFPVNFISLVVTDSFHFTTNTTTTIKVVVAVVVVVVVSIVCESVWREIGFDIVSLFFIIYVVAVVYVCVLHLREVRLVLGRLLRYQHNVFSDFPQCFFLFWEESLPMLLFRLFLTSH